MPNTLYLRDFLLRKLTNPTPGSSNATDFLGRAVAVGDKGPDGHKLAGKKWSQSAVVAVGDTTAATTGEILQCITAGTTSATGSGPTAPGYNQTRTDGTVTWLQVTNS